MPAQKTVSILAQKLGSKLLDAHKQLKDKPVEYGNARLPDGIENGVAQLVDMRFGVYKEGDNKGQPFFMAAGVVHEPAVHNGVGIAGLRTTLGPIPLCDTPKAAKKKTFADHYADYLNTLKQFDVTMPPEQQPGESGAASAERIEQYFITAMATLAETKPYFRFRTWKGKPSTLFPNPRVNEEWGGLTEYTPTAGTDAGAGMVDAAAAAEASQDPSPLDVQQEPEAQPDAQPEIDIAALIIAADADAVGKTDDGKAAIKTLTELAIAAGATMDQITNAASWQEVGGMIGGFTAEPEPAASTELTKGDQVMYKLRDAKGVPLIGKDKKERAAAKCEVTSVNAKTQTVTLKNLETNQPVVGADKKLVAVKWSDLE